jgi:hypothetical protein
MRAFNSTRHSWSARLCALSTVAIIAIIAIVGVLGNGCAGGTKEGERCNPLVLQDECNAGLHCKLATCSEAYCCPTDRSSTDPHCNAEGCPEETDAGHEGGSDEGAADGGSDGGNDATVDSASDTDASDGGDSG